MILKFQQGGASLPPLTSYEPVTVTGGASAGTASTSTKSADSSDLTDKDLLKMLEKLDGLPNDMQLITSELQNFYIDQQYGVNTSSIESRYLSVLRQMKEANFNQAQYKLAQDHVIKNGSINELAIDSRGRIQCINQKTGDFKTLTLEQLSSQKEYAPLTNAELLQLRAYNPELAYKNAILETVKNGIGINEINTYISNIIQGLGTNQNTIEGFGKTKAKRLVQGLEDFMKAIQEASGEQGYDGTVHDLYKFKYLTKEQVSNAEEAINYIYSTLPENAKTLLKIKSNSTSDDGPKKLIQTLISSQIDSTKDFTLDLVGGPTAKSNAKTAGSSSKDSTELETSLPLNVQKGIGGYEQFMTIDKGNGIQMNVTGTYYQQIKTPNGDPITNTSLETMLAQSGLQSIVKNVNNITFGDQKVNNEQLSKITYNNTGLIRANLPINSDGSVRLDILDAYQKAEAEVELLGETATAEQVSKIFEDHGLGDLINADGTLNKSKFAPFIITEGYTTENNNIQDSPFVYKVKDPSDQQIDLIKRSLTIGTGKEKEVPDIDTFDWYNPFDWFGVEDIYKAVIYIPISNNVTSAVYGADQKLDYDEATQQELKYRNFNKAGAMKSTSADVL